MPVNSFKFKNYKAKLFSKVLRFVVSYSKLSLHKLKISEIISFLCGHFEVSACKHIQFTSHNHNNPINCQSLKMNLNFITEFVY